MNDYEKLPTDFLIGLYHEIMKNIEKGLLTKNMYYELGLMILAARQRGMTLGKPSDFEQVVDPQKLKDFIQVSSGCKEGNAC